MHPFVAAVKNFSEGMILETACSRFRKTGRPLLGNPDCGRALVSNQAKFAYKVAAAAEEEEDFTFQSPKSPNKQAPLRDRPNSFGKRERAQGRL